MHGLSSMAQVADKLAVLVYGLQFTGWHDFGREKGGVVERLPRLLYINKVLYRIDN